MIRIAALALALAFAPASAVHAQGSEADAFTTLIADYEAFLEERDIMTRGRRGDLDAASRWPDASFEAVEAWDEAMAGFHARLEDIDPATLTGTDVASHAVLAYTLRTATELPRAQSAMTPSPMIADFIPPPISPP